MNKIGYNFNIPSIEFAYLIIGVNADGIQFLFSIRSDTDDFLKIISNRILEDNKKSKKQSYAIARFSGLGNKGHLNDFIKFCMNGDFYIS